MKALRDLVIDSTVAKVHTTYTPFAEAKKKWMKERKKEKKSLWKRNGT